MIPQTDFLFVSTNNSLKETIESIAWHEPVSLAFATRFDEALKEFDARNFKVVFFDLDDPALNSLQILEWLKTRHLIGLYGVIAEDMNAETVARALNLQATEFLKPSFFEEPEVLREKLEGILLRYQADQSLLFHEFKDAGGRSFCWVGGDLQIRGALDEMLSQASLISPLIITGEPGTGKRFLSQILALQKPDRPPLFFDAGTVPLALQKKALVALLEEVRPESGSTLVIRGIDSLHADLQAAWIRFLKEGVFLQNGRSDIRNLRLVGLSADCVADLILQGRLREDLALILSKSEIGLPPLRERPQDVPLLAEHFLHQLRPEAHHNFAFDAMLALMAYRWPGNLHELRETLKTIAEDKPPPLISARLLPQKVLQHSFYKIKDTEISLADYPYDEAKKMALLKFNQDYINEVLRRSQKNLTVAAEKAGMDRSNFKKIIRRYLKEGDV